MRRKRALNAPLALRGRRCAVGLSIAAACAAAAGGRLAQTVQHGGFNGGVVASSIEAGRDGGLQQTGCARGRVEQSGRAVVRGLAGSGKHDSLRPSRLRKRRSSEPERPHPTASQPFVS